MLLLAVLTALLLGNALSQECALPTKGEIETSIQSILASSGGEGTMITSVALLDRHDNCLAVINRADRFRSASVAVRYNVTLSSGTSEVSVSQLQYETCSGTEWTGASLEDPGALDVFNLPTRRDCTLCTKTDPGVQGVQYDADNNCAREYGG